MKHPHIIATVGLCGSGKSLASDYLESNGYTKVYFGGLTLEDLKKRGMEITPENEKKVREELRQTYGMGAYAVLSLPKIEEALAKHQPVLIDGLYSFSEYKILKEKFGNDLLVIALFTPIQLRYERLQKREYRPLTAQQARDRDYAEIENIEKGGPIAMADETILNTGNRDNLIQQLQSILSQLA